jgi:hypothetical protein
MHDSFFPCCPGEETQVFRLINGQLIEQDMLGDGEDRRIRSDTQSE